MVIPLIFPNVPQSSLGILRLPQLPPTLGHPPLKNPIIEYQTVDLKTHIMKEDLQISPESPLLRASIIHHAFLPMFKTMIQTKSIQQKNASKTKKTNEHHLNVPDTTTTSLALLVGASHLEQSISIFSTSSPAATAMCCHTNWTASVRRPKFRRALAKFLSSMNDGEKRVKKLFFLEFSICSNSKI